MKEDICTCSIKQPTQIGFVSFEKDVEYDLNKYTFHPEPKINTEIIESLKKKHFKKIEIEIKKSKTTGGKNNDSNS